ncbi:VOC family protein [Chitiniphilus purpureus]|uniref:VOC family protein n=1 Tax=Chitiniphilus purpureus TaxID=2981137 RepID=A0ABY6DIJ7_9NEIS|nr:VOC family protein [Chitiniphilus sp. CD1]UXY14161.1 VOC family protein [Chitiniphilus sp. CD1]
MPDPLDPLLRDHRPIIPYLFVHDAAGALAFYQHAFDAQVCSVMQDGERIGHAELRIRGQPFMLASEYPELEVLSPRTRGGSTVGLLLYVDDADASFARAIRAGARARDPVVDKPYGDRSGTLIDPFGHLWYISSRITPPSPQEATADQ